MAINIQAKKSDLKMNILRSLHFGPHTRALVLIDVADEAVRLFLMEALRAIDVTPYIATGSTDEKDLYLGFDACIWDGISDHIDLVQLVQSLVVPIVSKSSSYDKDLAQFNPMKFTGNAFLYEKPDGYNIFEKVVCYLENVSHSGDRSMLMKNLKNTF